MDTNRILNLKTLIGRSPILSQAERGEWLALLELMNDKQLGELEAILHVGMNNLPAKKPEPLVNGQGSLAHILNLPQVMAKTGSPQPKPLEKFPGSHGQPGAVSQTKPVNGFAQKLKDILAEKELPASPRLPTLGGPASPKIASLGKPTSPKMPSLGGTIPVAQGKPAEAKIPPPELKTPLQPYKPTIANMSPVQKPKVLPPVPPKMPPAAVEKPKLDLTSGEFKHLSAGDLELHGLPKIPSRPLAADKFNPGLVFPKSTTQSSMRDFKTAEVKLNSALHEMAARQPVHSGGFLQTLTDVAELTLEIWEAHETAATVSAFKKLMSKYGYHQVIFNLESSPIYKIYLDTGIKLLKERGSFEQLSSSQYFTREQFEQFTDMLRQIQAS